MKKVSPFSAWLSSDPVVAHAEKQFLLLSIYWVGIMAVIVATGIYDGSVEYHTGLLIVILIVLCPFVPHSSEKRLPWYNRFGVKANAGHGCVRPRSVTSSGPTISSIFLCKYTFCHMESERNPIRLWPITQAYFLLYHTLSNMLLARNGFVKFRAARCGRSCCRSRVLVHRGDHGQSLSLGVLLFAFTLHARSDHFYFCISPYYDWQSPRLLYLRLGLLCYLLHCVVPRVLASVAEALAQRAHCLCECFGRVPLTRLSIGAARDGLAAAMMVFIMLDWWRLAVGAITHVGNAAHVPFAQAT